MKSGFVNIFGKPNTGKSTLLNALTGEKLAIVTSKVQTTRHRIKGIVSTPAYQIVFSDTPGIIEPRSKLDEKMMNAVNTAVEDADVMLLVHDLTESPEPVFQLFSVIKSKAPKIVVLNKKDLTNPQKTEETINYFKEKGFENIIAVSAMTGTGISDLTDTIVGLLPEGDPFYSEEDITDLPVRFFVSEIIREKIFVLFKDEIPYHSTVLVQEFSEKSTLVKIRADIIVQRESQKAIIIGHKGQMIKKVGTAARTEIEEFIGSKVFLELMVKVRPKWRDNEIYLREYGYQ